MGPILLKSSWNGVRLYTGRLFLAFEVAYIEILLGEIVVDVFYSKTGALSISAENDR